MALRLKLRARLVLFVCLVAWVGPAMSQEAPFRSGLTPEQVKGRIEEVRESQKIEEVAQAQAIVLYRQTVANLEATRAHRRTRDDYRQTASTAPDRTAAIREAIDRVRGTDPTAALGIDESDGAERVRQALESENDRLTTLENTRAELEAAIDRESLRRATARQRIRTARQLVEEARDAMSSPSPSGQSPFLTEGAQWAAQTRVESLLSEIAMLEEQLLTYDARVGLLQAQRDEAVLEARRAGLRVDTFRSVLTERRRDVVRKAEAQAKGALEGLTEREPAIRDLARANLELVELFGRQVDELETLRVEERELRPLPSRLNESFRSARRKLELKGAPLGHAIREQRQQLPAAEFYELRRKRLRKPVTVISLRLLENEEEFRELADLDAYVRDLVAASGSAEPDAAVRQGLDILAATRRVLLATAIDNDRVQQHLLYALDDLLRQLEERTGAYDRFLSERLLWVRSSPPFRLRDFSSLPGEMTAFFAPKYWSEAARTTARGFRLVPWLLIPVLLAGFVLVRGRWLRSAVLACGKDVRSVRRDRMSLTIRAVGLTLLIAVSGPLLLAAAGWAMVWADTVTPLLAGSLLRTAGLLLSVNVVLGLTLPGGVAERHFGWDATTVSGLRRALGWFRWVGVPAFFLMATMDALDPSIDGGTLGVLAALLYLLVVLVLTVRLLHPTRGVIRVYLASRTESRWWRWRHLWLAIVVMIPLSTAIAVLTGYVYTAGELDRRWTLSYWLVVGAWLAGQLVGRWLLVTRRRLAFAAAVREREIARAARQGDDLPEGKEQTAATDDIGAPELDLVALDADSRRIVHATLVVAVLLGLAGIWGDMLPAFQLLGEVTLWSTTSWSGGVEVRVAVTASDVLAALLIAIGGWIATKNLPSLIDIVLLKGGRVTAGNRYAISTIAKYVIVFATTLLVLGQLGASWSQMGWAVAAMGVGIGFGLQEIVANFISGLILLAERPVRVGDLITVGDASGTVLRIRIRATTILNFDRQELLIPNKELITGRLLNWTLSDKILRVVIEVGIQYGSDVDRALRILMELARADERVLSEPEPSVVFNQFADSSLNLLLRVFVGSPSERLPVRTDMHRRIHTRFAEEGLVIAFPQRDVHLYKTEENPDGSPAESGSP